MRGLALPGGVCTVLGHSETQFRVTRSTVPSISDRKCEIEHCLRPPHPPILRGVLNPDNFTDDALVNTCRQLRKLLASAGTSPALRIAAPQLHQALPLATALVLGIEDLADRIRLLEIARGK